MAASEDEADAGRAGEQGEARGGVGVGVGVGADLPADGGLDLCLVAPQPGEVRRRAAARAWRLDMAELLPAGGERADPARPVGEQPGERPAGAVADRGQRRPERGAGRSAAP